MTARQQYAYDFFLKKDYAPLGAAAIVGNLSGESGVNLDSTMERGARADHGSGGIAEWRLERKNNLYKFAKSHHVDVNDLGIQCAFVIHELENGDDGRSPGEYSWLNDQLKNPGTRTIDNLVANFCFTYERPNRELQIRGGHLNKRIQYAKDVLKEAQAGKTKTVVKEAVVAGGVATIGAGAVAGGLNGDEITAAITAGSGVIASIIGLWLNRRSKPPVEAQPIEAGPQLSLMDELKALVETRSRADARIEEIVRAVQSQAEETREIIAKLPAAAIIEHQPAIGDNNG